MEKVDGKIYKFGQAADILCLFLFFSYIINSTNLSFAISFKTIFYILIIFEIFINRL